MSAYLKTVLRTVKDNLGRFIAVTLIIMLGVAFLSGLGTLSYKMNRAIGEGYAEANSPDVIVRALKAPLSNDIINGVAQMDGVVDTQAYFGMDSIVNEKRVRVLATNLSDQKINVLTLLEGRYPESASEIVAERSSDVIPLTQIGDKITVMGGEKTVVGIVSNPMYIYLGGEPYETEESASIDSVKDMEMLDLIVYLDMQYVSYLPATQIYVQMQKEEGVRYLSEEYDEQAEWFAEQIASLLNDSESYACLTLKSTLSYSLAESYEDKITVIVAIFPVFFIAVSALVVLTTMTRMIEEERAAIGCYRTLGYGEGKICFKYLFFSIACCLVGSGGGIAIGLTLLPAVIFPAFSTMFAMPAWEQWVQPLMGVVASVAMLIVVCVVTFYLIKRELKGAPAEILRPKSPKAGKKIFLERIPFIWNKLSFRFKSTFRNIFRYVKHLLMTVISVAGATALVLAGLGLSDTCRSDAVRADFPGMADSVAMISVVIIIFAGLLSVLVVYNLTNMNVGERRRELATLKVLGYRHLEVCGYVFREVLIMALMGICVGIPLGFGLLYFAFSYLDFGSVADVKWYSYLLAVLFVLLTVAIVDLLLSGKVRKIDMTTSLKSVE